MNKIYNIQDMPMVHILWKAYFFLLFSFFFDPSIAVSFSLGSSLPINWFHKSPGVG